MKRARVVGLSLLLLLTLFPDAVSSKKKRQAETMEDLQVVDCLLPGKVRRLGRNSTFLTPRQPVRTSAVDCEIRGGEYTAYDRASYATALAVWLPAAEAGDAQAQTYVGEIFEKGLAAIPDYEAAATWYRKAAEQDDSRAQINLGHLYEKGLGVPLDPQTALEWYRRAAGIDAAVVLDWTEQEETLRRETEELRRDLDATRRRLDATSGELAAAQAEAAELRRQLDEARRSQALSEDERKALEARLAASEARAGEIRQSISDYRDRLARLEAASTSGAELAPPEIAIISPDVLATRGPSIVAVPSGVAELEITGRVTAPAGLDKLLVDGAERTTEDDSGFFRVSVAAPAGRTALVIEALDRRGRVARRELLLEPGARGPVPAPPTTPPPRRAPRPSPDLHALVISAARYQNLEPLRTAAADAAEVARLLAEKYGYQTTVLRDPTHFEILAAINDLAARLEEKDHLLIYYAGHGKIEGGKGYWIGVDGAADDSALWIPNEAISDQLDVMKAREVLVVSDSCYSGTLTLSGVARPGDEDERAARLERIASRRSRTVLTSGGLAPVLDEGGGAYSIFAQAFLRVLELNERALAGTELHREVAARVRYAARGLGFRQTPGYAPIRYAGHEAGDYVLAPRS
jgi:hypothetical protein